MTSTVDRRGRIHIPKAIREAVHLSPGTEVRFRLQGDHVEIEPVPLTVTLQRRGSLVVAVPPPKQPVLKATQADETIARLRDGAARRTAAE